MRLFLDDLRLRATNLFVAVDQLCWVLVTLGHGAPDESISAALYRMELQGKWAGRLLRPVVDVLLHPLGPDHCYWAHVAEVRGEQQHDFHEGKICK